MVVEFLKIALNWLRIEFFFAILVETSCLTLEAPRNINKLKLKIKINNYKTDTEN